jgi:2-keto-3-deoxy-L-rhamnonate aldolase RhmA
MDGRLKRAVEAGDPVVGSWASIGHPAMAEIPAALAFDFVVVDTEHAPTSLETVENMIRAVEAADGPTEPLVRVAANDPVRIKRVLDLGVGGVMVPMVETADEAAAAVDAVRYPPEGNRGIAPGRSSRYGLDLAERVDSGGEDLLVVVQIESERGLENVEDIVAIDGVDVAFVGPADLSASLGRFADWDHDRYRAAVERVVAAADEAGVAAGTLAFDASDVHKQLETGFSFVIAGVDAAHVVDGCREVKRAYEANLDGSAGT